MKKKVMMSEQRYKDTRVKGLSENTSYPSRQDPPKNACTLYRIFACVYVVVEVPDYY